MTKDLGQIAENIATGFHYFFEGTPTPQELEEKTYNVLSNIYGDDITLNQAKEIYNIVQTKVSVSIELGEKIA